MLPFSLWIALAPLRAPELYCAESEMAWLDTSHCSYRAINIQPSNHHLYPVLEELEEQDENLLQGPALPVKKDDSHLRGESTKGYI